LQLLLAIYTKISLLKLSILIISYFLPPLVDAANFVAENELERSQQKNAFIEEKVGLVTNP
jgi:hypothetical protein